MTKLRSHVVTVLLAAGVALGWFVFWLWASDGLPTLKDPYTVRAEVPSAAALAPGASVRVAGLEVGSVKSIGRKGGIAVLELEIDDERAPIPKDTRVSVRLRTIVGENYVDLHPGSSRSELADGETVPLSQAGDYVEVDQILNVLRGPTRERAKQFIQGLGYGVRARGPQLNRYVEGASGTIEEASAVSRVLARDRRQVARLVENFGDVSRSISERGTALRQMAIGMQGTFESVALRNDALRTMLQQLSPTLRQVRRTTGIVRSVTAQAAPVLADLGAGLRELKPAILRLRPASEEGRRLLRELGRSAPALQGTLRRAMSLSAPTARALPDVRRTLCQLNPTLEYAAPYGKDIGSFFGTFVASSANSYDANGHVLRLTALVGAESVNAWPKVARDAAQTLLESGLVSEAHFNGYNPFPGPGGADDLDRGVNVTGPDEYPYKYTRVHAEC